MIRLKWWQYDCTGLEDAKRQDAEADTRLRVAQARARWARKALEMNHLTERFYSELDLRGGKP